MNVVYSSDEHYAQHLCVSLISLLDNNKDVQTLNIFIISNGISAESQRRISGVAEQFDRMIEWIDFTPFQDELKLNMEWKISISSYARLFISSMLPDGCKKAIYLDCDTVVCGSLSEMWDTEMGTASVAGVEDLIKNEFKKKIGIPVDANYINAGVLLIDIEKWRKQSAEKQFLDFINKRDGQVTHHDQGVINGTMNAETMILPPQYNAMTPFFTTKYERLLKIYQLKKYYSPQEIQCAVENPVIIHYTPEYVGRVWEYECKHPKAEVYRSYLELTPWRGCLTHAKRLPAKLRILYWMQKKLPVWLINLLIKSR